jgi:hypothetical protein
LYRRSSGEWSDSTELISLDFAYEGRPAACMDAEETIWFFYHTLRKGKWDIWYKKLFTYDIDLGFQSELDNRTISNDLKQVLSNDLKQAFEDDKFSLSLSTTVEIKDSIWLITDADNKKTFTIRQELGKLIVQIWTPSKPLTNRSLIDKHPTVVFQNNALKIFWGVYDEKDQKWHIDYRSGTGGEWSEIDSSEPFADTTNERKKPCAVVDIENGLWLFWLEKVDHGWQLKYNRYNGTNWELDPTTFPLDTSEDPKVESDPFVLFHPTDTNQKIWVFWARKETTDTSKSLVIAYRVKQGIDPSASDWSEIRTLPKVPPDANYNDHEPAAIVKADGNIELWWSSNKDGSWSIWQNTLDITTLTWETRERITMNPYSQRNSLPLLINGGTLLIYRSNRSLSYSSKVYSATKTVDFRYAGSTTVDTRNSNKIALKNKFGDFLNYSYDAARTNDDWYARDTIGLYLAADNMDNEELKFGVARIEKVLDEFMPITDRAVFIPRSNVHTDFIYSYDKPAIPQVQYISESIKDSINSEMEEQVLSPTDDYTDEIT